MASNEVICVAVVPDAGDASTSFAVLVRGGSIKAVEFDATSDTELDLIALWDA